MQTDTQTVLQHGESVWEFTKRLIARDWKGLRIPDWLSTNYMRIVNNLHSTEVIKNYNIYHDCGKPYCLEVDEESKRHYPNHAQVSYETYLEVFGDETVARLIRDDMCLHTETAEQLESKDWIIQDAFTLLITGLAELHSNAQMFGGVESTSFKMKWKKIDQRGKQLCKKFLPDLVHTYSYLIVRNDLPNIHKLVQSVHVGMELKQDHYSVISLVVRNENKLKAVIKELLENGISVKVFTEPDLGDTITAICTEPLLEKRDFLKRFQLLKM